MLSTQSVEISWFFYQSDFTWNQFWGIEKCKICHFNTFKGSEFWFSWFFVLLEGCNWPKYLNSEPKNDKSGIFWTSSFSKIDFTILPHCVTILSNSFRAPQMKMEFMSNFQKVFQNKWPKVRRIEAEQEMLY